MGERRNSSESDNRGSDVVAATVQKTQASWCVERDAKPDIRICAIWRRQTGHTPIEQICRGKCVAARIEDISS